MSWVERATELLHDTESIREEVRIGTGGVVVTNQRLLVFTPDQSGANFRQVDRPNVESVERATSGEGKFLMPGVKAGILGVVMVAFGYAFNFDEFAEGIALDGGTGAAGAVGVGGLLGMVQTVIELFAMLDDLLRLFGGLALAFSAVALGVYIWSRNARLVVSVAGGDDIELLADDGIDDELVDRLRRAVESGGTAPAPSPGEPTAESESDDPLGDKLDAGDGATDQAAGGTVEDSDAAAVDETAVENVLGAMDDTGDGERDGVETTDDGTLDLSDPKES